MLKPVETIYRTEFSDSRVEEVAEEEIELTGVARILDKYVGLIFNPEYKK